MASYLTTASVGEFERSYRHRGISLIDAVDPDLYGPTGTPRTGSQFAIAQVGEPAYKRLARTIAVPAGGATLSFWIKRDTEANWDHVFVEAHTVGADDWTTLPDLNGHTSADTGFSCPSWLGLHPFLEHYQADNGDGTCSPAGSSGVWRARSGSSDGYEQWRVDLGAYAGKTVEVSISYASDEVFQFSGAFVDDIVVSTSAGTTSFEADENTFDGWTVPGAPAGSPPNPNDWIVGTAANTPPPLGVNIDASLARQAEILDFEEDVFGPYPFGLPAASSTTRTRSASRSRIRRGPSMRRASSANRCRGTASSCTSWPTSGTATALRLLSGSTSGSTRALRPMRSGSGASAKG